MKLLCYCLLSLFTTGVQPKPQITKLFPVEELVAYHRQQLSNITKPIDKFLGKLRATYNLVFHQPDNISNIERIFTKESSPDPNFQALKVFWTNQVKLDNYTNLKYPNDTFLDHVKSLSIPKDQEDKVNSSNHEKVEIKSTIKTNNVSLPNSSVENFNKTKTLYDDEWFNDIQPLENLELQDEEELDKRKEVEIVTPGTTIQLPKMVGRHLLEWFGSLFGLTYSVYTKLASAVCGNAKKT